MATLPAANTAEGGSNGTTVAVGNSGGVSGDAFDAVNIDASAAAVFDSSQSVHGALAYKLTGSGSGGAQLEWDSTQTTVYGRAYILGTSFPAGVTAIIDARNAGAGAGSVRMTATQKLAVYDASGTVRATGTTTIATSTWYRVEFGMVFNTTTGSLTANLYAGDSGSLIEAVTASSLNTNTTMTQLFFAWRSYGANSLWFDDIQLNITGYPGPTSGNATASPLVVGAQALTAQPSLGQPGQRFVLRQAAQQASRW